MSRDSSYIEHNEMEAAVGTVPELIHAMSHDIGEPVREILGFAKLIAARAPHDVDPHFLADLDHVTSGALRTRAMLEVLCEYIRIDTTQPDIAMIDLSHLAERLEAYAGRVAESPGAHPVRLAVALSGVIAGFPQVLDTVLEELILNASRFGASPDGWSRVTVVGDVGADFFEVTVSDAGSGIPADATERAMQLFQRLHPRSEHDTMGAGLALARRRLEHCGGELRIAVAVPGSGLSATARLPLPAIDLRDREPGATRPTSRPLTLHSTEGEVR